MEYMVPPIQLCTNGHNICSKCRGRESVQHCSTCRAEFSEIRNVALENIARSLKYPCENRKSGCHKFFTIENIAEHHAHCNYGKIKYPFAINWMCNWKA
jgi:E3 ubiquitin-protein ligase SIAH1